MPERMLREGLRASRRIGAVSEGAECLFTRLILSVCDHGRFHADPHLVKAAAMPNRPRLRTSDIASRLDELEKAGLIVRYDAPPGTPLLTIPRFGQRLKYRRASPFPAPPGKPPDPPGQQHLPLNDEAEEFVADPGGEEKRREKPPVPPKGGAPEKPAPAERRARRRRGHLYPREIEKLLATARTRLAQIVSPYGVAHYTLSAAEQAQRDAVRQEIADLEAALRQAVRDSLNPEGAAP